MPTSSKQQAAAKAAGLRYYHVPFNGARPDAKVAQQFLAAITTKGAEPAFIHCASANRASAMWLIKRIVIDHWDVERATTEATALGLSNGALRTWALDYARTAKQSVPPVATPPTTAPKTPATIPPTTTPPKAAPKPPETNPENKEKPAPTHI